MAHLGSLPDGSPINSQTRVLELRGECVRRHLAHDGTKAILLERLAQATITGNTCATGTKRTADSDTPVTSKKFRNAIDKVADEYICPITAELPLDPVTAEDGHIYERKAIEEFFSSHRAANTPIKSPMTNLPMDCKLLPNKQARNAIETLVRSGAICGDKAAPWLKRLRGEEKMKALKAKAESGDISAIDKIAHSYDMGINGFVKDYAAAFHWLDVGAKAGSVYCMRKKGFALLSGKGVRKQSGYGLGLIFQAGEAGSQTAACMLAIWFDEGCHDLPKDRKQANYWYRKTINAVEDIYNKDFRGMSSAERIQFAASRMNE